MFLRAGAVSLALLLASRLLGLVRESAQAGAFGATGMGDLAVLMLTLPDWLASVVAGGALAYVLLPAWAEADAGRIAAMQQRVQRGLLLLGLVLAVLLAIGRGPILHALADGLPESLLPAGERALLWSALALPLALLAGAGSARLQHERDFLGLYSANLVVNLVLIATLAAVASLADDAAVLALGAGLLVAMAGRLGWQAHRQRPFRHVPAAAGAAALPPVNAWVWSAAAVGLPLALPFVARSLASQQGPGALATFNYAWKLVELPLLLAVQLVGTLALGPISQALRGGGSPEAVAAPVRRGFALAWTMGCASAAGLLVAAPAIAQLLFDWGRMQEQALLLLAGWARVGAWSLLPQALVTIAMAVLAAQGRMWVAVLGYAVALACLVLLGPAEGGGLMLWLNVTWLALAVLVLLAVGPRLLGWLPWRAFLGAGLPLAGLAAVLSLTGLPPHAWMQWASAVVAGTAIFATAWLASRELRQSLGR